MTVIACDDLSQESNVMCSHHTLFESECQQRQESHKPEINDVLMQPALAIV